MISNLYFYFIVFFSTVKFIYPECIKECYDRNYNGIMSMYSFSGHCSPWKNSVYKRTYPNAISNFCSMYDSDKPWCPTPLGKKVCEVTKCTKSYEKLGCVMNIEVSMSSTTVNIQWQIPETYTFLHSYVILLHNSENICVDFQRQICNNCDTSLSTKIERFLLSCKTGTFKRYISNETKFENLESEKSYIAYILPFINRDTFGKIKKVFLKTPALNKPEKPINIKNLVQSLSTLSFTWNESPLNSGRNIPQYYLAKLTNIKSNVTISKNVTNPSVDFLNLNMCSEYCFQVIAVNFDGQSPSSDMLYAYTTGPDLGKVIISKIFLMPSSNIQISWKYSGSLECSVYFKVNYSIKGESSMKSLNTDSNFLILSDLKKNVFYNVKINAFIKMTKDTFKSGPVSDTKEFYAYEDCFDECYSSTYTGIMSMYNITGSCIPWKNSPFKSTGAVSNICSMHKEKKPWCATKNGWEYCEIPKCKKTHMSCVTNVKLITTSTSVTIQWTSPSNIKLKHGYLTLLYNTDHICESYHRQLCNNCKGYVSSDIDRLYIHCKTGRFTKEIKHMSTFDNLQENTNYIIYIVPLLTVWRKGSIKNVSVTTPPFGRPDKINNLTVIKKTIKSLSFSWNEPKSTEKVKVLDYFLAVLTNSKSQKKFHKKVESPMVDFSDLEMCSEYCLQVSSVNIYGHSKENDKLCSFTLAPNPGNIRLNHIESGSYPFKHISWEYKKVNNCPIYFRVDYGIGNKFPINYIETNLNYVILSELKNKKNYNIMVRAKSNITTEDVSYRVIPECKEFNANSEKYSYYLELQKVLDSFFTESSYTTYKVTMKGSNDRFSIKYDKIGKINIFCNLGELLKIFIEMEIEGKPFQIPFNTSCGITDIRHGVKSLVIKSSTKGISLSWKVSTKESHMYIIYWMNNKEYFYKYVKTAHTEYFLNVTKNSNWQQICIATIDNKWITSQYTCNQYSLYPGHILNLRAYSTTKEIYVSWDKSKQDIHHGYVVNVTLPNEPCQSSIIKMEDFCLDVISYCNYYSFMKWSFLKSLIFQDMNPGTMYTISVSSIKGNQMSKPSFIQIRTKNIKIVENVRVTVDEFQMHIKFEPSKEINMRYKLRVTLHDINMCSLKFKVIFDDVINSTFKVIKTNFPMSCFDYTVEVKPVPQCNFYQKLSTFDLPKIDHISLITEGRVYKGKDKSTKLKNLKVELLSINLLKVSWSNVVPKHDCNRFDFMVELMSVVNEDDCKTWIIIKSMCTILKNDLEKESKCKNKEYLQYQDEVIKTSLFLYGNFKVANTYRAQIWKISKNIEKILIAEVKYNKKSDCFTDCYGATYSGLRSATIDGRICLKWDKFSNVSKYSNYRSNICHIDKNSNIIPWCFYERFGHRIACDIPKCRKIVEDDEKCSENIKMLPVNNRIIVKLPLFVTTSNNIRGYIILLHNQKNECEKYIIKICTNCIHLLKMKINIQGFYMSCRSGSIINNWNKETIFHGLRMNTQYIIYVIPLLTHATVGEILNVTVATTVSDPIYISYMEATNRKPRTLQFIWNSYKKRKSQALINHYKGTLVNMKSKTKLSIKSTNFMEEFKDLEASTKYCFFLTIVYKTGFSEFVDSVCTHTSASHN